MIPKTQLESIKPFQDQLNRMNQVKSKRKQFGQRLSLTKRARQWAWFGSSGLRIMKDYKGPQGQRQFGRPAKEKKK